MKIGGVPRKGYKSDDSDTRNIALTPLKDKVGTTGSEVNPDSLVFPVSPNALRLTWQRMQKATGIKDLHFHDLRHEAISRFFELGLTVPEVASISGHRDMRMLFRYAHANPDRILEKIR